MKLHHNVLVNGVVLAHNVEVVILLQRKYTIIVLQ